MTDRDAAMREALAMAAAFVTDTFRWGNNEGTFEVLERLRTEIAALATPAPEPQPDKSAAMREALEMAADLIERNGVSYGGGGATLRPRIEGDRTGLEYAAAIRALAIPAPEPVAPPQQAGVTEAMAAELEDARYKADYWKRMHDEVRAAHIVASSQQAGATEAMVERLARAIYRIEDGETVPVYIMTQMRDALTAALSAQEGE